MGSLCESGSDISNPAKSLEHNWLHSYRFSPRSALKAGSTFPPLAFRTALTTAASIEGKASFRVISACCAGAKGRGGLGGGMPSSPAGGEGSGT